MNNQSFKDLLNNINPSAQQKERMLDNILSNSNNSKKSSISFKYGLSFKAKCIALITNVFIHPIKSFNLKNNYLLKIGLPSALCLFLICAYPYLQKTDLPLSDDLTNIQSNPMGSDPSLSLNNEHIYDNPISQPLQLGTILEDNGVYDEIQRIEFLFPDSNTLFKTLDTASSLSWLDSIYPARLISDTATSSNPYANSEPYMSSDTSKSLNSDIDSATSSLLVNIYLNNDITISYTIYPDIYVLKADNHYYRLGEQCIKTLY